MSCSHNKREVILTGEWKRKKPSVVSSDIGTILKCKSCGAIRIDWKNEYCYSQGVWSERRRKL